MCRSKWSYRATVQRRGLAYPTIEEFRAIHRLATVAKYLSELNDVVSRERNIWKAMLIGERIMFSSLPTGDTDRE
jgi:hypothetical protein